MLQMFDQSSKASPDSEREAENPDQTSGTSDEVKSNHSGAIPKTRTSGPTLWVILVLLIAYLFIQVVDVDIQVTFGVNLEELLSFALLALILVWALVTRIGHR